MAARLKDEAGARAGLFAADAVFVQNHEPSIQELPDVDRAPRIRTRAAQLDPAWAEPHRVVARDDAAIAAAEHHRQIPRRPPPDRLRRPRRFAEARVEVADEGRQVRL